jgi:glucokinase
VPRQAVVALDVGGTTVDAACVSDSGEVLGEVLEVGSPAGETADEIADELARAIETARGQAGTFTVTACGVAIPAPFDYAAGVSYMKHKFQAIYGVNLGELLRARTGLPAYFVNDADAFGLGVSWRQLPGTKRFVALTIGTGLGGSFIEDGTAVGSGPRVPPGGEVWNLPYSDGILEDYVSAHGVVALYARRVPGSPASGSRASAKDVADLAVRGDSAAAEAYREMGTVLGRGLAPVFSRFAPEAIVVGGKVGQSLGLFGPAMSQALAESGAGDMPVIPADPGNMAIWGAARSASAGRQLTANLPNVQVRRYGQLGTGSSGVHAAIVRRAQRDDQGQARAGQHRDPDPRPQPPAGR